MGNVSLFNQLSSAQLTHNQMVLTAFAIMDISQFIQAFVTDAHVIQHGMDIDVLEETSNALKDGNGTVFEDIVFLKLDVKRIKNMMVLAAGASLASF